MTARPWERTARALGVTLALCAVCPHPADAQPVRADEPADRPFCSACIPVSIGVGLIIAAIPLFVQAELREQRDTGVGVARRIVDCGTAPELCEVLGSVDTNATPWWVGAAVTGGLGVAAIATGALVAWQVPSSRGKGGARVEIRPRQAGGTATVRWAW